MPYVYFISCFCLPNTVCVCLHLNKLTAEVLVTPLVISGQNVVMSQFQYFKNGVFFFFFHLGSFNFKSYLMKDFFLNQELLEKCLSKSNRTRIRKKKR